MFRVEVTGDDLQFQWQKDCNDIHDRGGRYCGTNTDTLHILMVEKGDEGCYRCLVKNCVEKIVSNNAILTVSKLVLTSYIHMVNMCLAVGKLEASFAITLPVT